MNEYLLEKFRDLDRALVKPLDYEEGRRVKSQIALLLDRKYGKKHEFYLRCHQIENGFYLSAVAEQADFRRLVGLVITDLELQGSDTAGQASLALKSSVASNAVFVVHGHDEGMKEAVARFLERLGFDGVVLHERADKGRTIIEKISDHSSVRFAIVLFSPDDLGRSKADAGERPRARQNVVLELGFFLGLLGRQRVVCLFRDVPDFEMPSDYSGVLFKPYDKGGAWRMELARELKAAGYAVDANRLMS